jgi:hypothetical protein
MLFTRERVHDGQTQRFTITRGEFGWHVREEHDSRVVRSVNYTDWHRVERAIYVFEMGVAAADPPRA